MTPESNKPKSAHNKMKSFKVVLDKAPAGPKKDASFIHFQAAEYAARIMNDAETYRELDAASQAFK